MNIPKAQRICAEQIVHKKHLLSLPEKEAEEANRNIPFMVRVQSQLEAWEQMQKLLENDT